MRLPAPWDAQRGGAPVDAALRRARDAGAPGDRWVLIATRATGGATKRTSSSPSRRDRCRTYATRYHQAFLSRSLGASVEHLQLTDPSATAAAWLELAITSIIANFKDGPPNPQIDPGTAALLRELAQELDDAAEHIGGAAGLARALADLAVAAQAGSTTKDFWGALQAAENSWVKAGYVFARAIYVIAIVGGLLAAIVSFINWDKLTKPQQGEAVTATVETAAKIVETVKEIWSGEWGFEQSGQADIALSDTSLTQPLLDPYTADQLQDATGGIADMADGEAGALDTTGTKWGELFTSFEGVMSVIGAAAAVALAVLSTVTFIDDIINHASVSTTVLDGIITAANYGVASDRRSRAVDPPEPRWLEPCAADPDHQRLQPGQPDEHVNRHVCHHPLWHPI